LRVFIGALLFFKASGVEMKDILTPPFAIFCTDMTDFHSWENMAKAAKDEYLQRRPKSQ
jgi:hypothetical protein